MLTTYYYFDQSKIIWTSNIFRNDVTLIEKWIKHNYLMLNTSKCKSMIVSRKKSQSYSFTLTLGGQQLEVVESFKYL